MNDSEKTAACLVSRIPYGEALEADMLGRPDEAESFLRDAREAARLPREQRGR